MKKNVKLLIPLACISLCCLCIIVSGFLFIKSFPTPLETNTLPTLKSNEVEFLVRLDAKNKDSVIPANAQPMSYVDSATCVSYFENVGKCYLVPVVVSLNYVPKNNLERLKAAIDAMLDYKFNLDSEGNAMFSTVSRSEYSFCFVELGDQCNLTFNLSLKDQNTVNIDFNQMPLKCDYSNGNESFLGTFWREQIAATAKLYFPISEGSIKGIPSSYKMACCSCGG